MKLSHINPLIGNQGALIHRAPPAQSGHPGPDVQLFKCIPIMQVDRIGKEEPEYYNVEEGLICTNG